MDWPRLDRELGDMDRTDKQLARLRAAMLVAPGDPQGEVRLVKLLARSGSRTEALAHGRRLRDRGFLTPTLAQQLGDVLADAGVQEEALRTYSEIVEFDGQSALSRKIMGDIFLRQGGDYRLAYTPRMRSRFTATMLASLLLVSCGGGKPPAAVESLKNDAGVETFGEVNASDLAELDAGALNDAAPARASAAAPSSPPTPADDCTPVGVDFEKRARPKLKDCYASGKKKDPNLQGTVKIAVEIDPAGKVKAIKITAKTLPDPVAQCMLKVVKATPLPEASKCPAKTFTIPMTFPTPH